MPSLSVGSTLKIAKMTQATDVNGEATLEVKVPGTVGEDGARLIYGGQGWFENPAHGDEVVSILIVDNDNILGFGAGAAVGSYTDTDVPTANQGWHISKTSGRMILNAVGGEGRLVGGLYLQIKVKAAANRADTFRANLSWGLVE